MIDLDKRPITTHTTAKAIGVARRGWRNLYFLENGRTVFGYLWPTKRIAKKVRVRFLAYIVNAAEEGVELIDMPCRALIPAEAFLGTAIPIPFHERSS